MPVTRPPPPTGRPPAYAIASRAFGRTNLRPIVTVCTIIGAVWSLVWAAGAFRDISGVKQDPDLKKLVTFDIILGSLYAGVAAIELFGLFAAATRKAALVRIFVFLSVGVAAIVAAAELTRTIAHFTFENAIKKECVDVSTNPDIVFGFDFWGNVIRGLNHDEAVDFCNRNFSRQSIASIAWLIFATLFALFFASIAYSFYRQLLDPTFFRAQAPSEQVRLQALSNQNQNTYGYGVPYDQQQPYGYPAPQQGYGGGYNPYPSFAPPPGPPPPQGGYAPPYDTTKLPGYGTDGGVVKDLQDDKEDPFKDSSAGEHPPAGGPRNDDPFRNGGRNT